VSGSPRQRWTWGAGARAAGVLALLLPQLVWVLLTHAAGLNAARIFVWAPNDYALQYACTARVEGRVLGPREFETRYRLPMRGFYESPAEDLTGLLRAREEAHGGGEAVALTVHYRLNTQPPRVWRWSQGAGR
jgi:hypothetical protein